MKEDVLVIKKKNGTQFKVKVAKRARNSYSEALYQNTVNIRDVKQLAQMLEDLRVMFDAPIEKAVKEMKKDKFSYW